MPTFVVVLDGVGNYLVGIPSLLASTFEGSECDRVGFAGDVGAAVSVQQSGDEGKGGNGETSDNEQRTERRETDHSDRAEGGVEEEPGASPMDRGSVRVEGFLNDG